MLAGVTVVDPASTWVDVTVSLEPDVALLPGTQLHGATSVACGRQIGPDTTLSDCTIGAGASVIRTHGSEATIAAGGPSGRSPTCGRGPGSASAGRSARSSR